MVLSGSKRTTYMSSIVNQNSGGGPKKAGLPFQIGREASVSIAYKNTSQNLVFLQGPKAMLKQALMIARYYLAKAVAVKAAADAVVTAKIATADALYNVTVESTDNDAAISGVGGMIPTLDVAGKITTADALDNVTVETDTTNEQIQQKITDLDVSGKETTYNDLAAGTDKDQAGIAYNDANTAALALQAIIDARTAVAALQAIVDARVPAGTAEDNVTTEQGKVTTAQSNLNAYTKDV
jgi:hypothetical protein